MLNITTITKNILLFIYLPLLLVDLAPIQAQVLVDTTFPKKIMTYSEYMEAVVQNNLSYAAEKLNINIAQAAIEKATIIPDPELSAGFFNNDQQHMKMGYGYDIGLDWTLELGGKRKARVNLAKSESELAQHALQEFFQNLRSDATTQYLTAVYHEQLVKLQLNSYEALNQLSKSDSIRAKLGAITAIDAKQSKLEAASMWNEVIQSIGYWKSALGNLDLLMGSQQAKVVTSASGGFSTFNRNFHLHDLLEQAQLYRSDLLYAWQHQDVSKKTLELVKANRVIDLGLNTGLTRNAAAHNEVAPSPAFTATNIGISLPLKFSNKRKGELKEAYYTLQQSEVQYKQIELQVHTEVVKAYYQYEATQKQLQQFTTGLLQDAQAILKGKRYSYERGESSLLEVLHAQRTYIEMQQHYYETLFNNAVALVELERSAGIWDIYF
ncbi:TolC family protein [Sphingobacterium faecium]|jgi:cobalt-zinc-cadmium efflux system outer membrane protein